MGRPLHDNRDLVVEDLLNPLLTIPEIAERCQISMRSVYAIAREIGMNLDDRNAIQRTIKKKEALDVKLEQLQQRFRVKYIREHHNLIKTLDNQDEEE